MKTRPVLALVNDAGSAGKTTSAVTIAAILAGQGRQVLLIDLDSQANATRWVGISAEEVTHTSGDVLLRTSTLAETTLKTTTHGLHVLPGSPALRHQRLQLGTITGAEQRLRTALREDDHDIVIIDSQAGAGELYPLAAMVAATAVLTVTLPGPKELEGIPRVEELISDIAEAYNPALDLAGIIPCAVPPPNRGRLYSDAIVQLREAYGDMVTPVVRHSVTAVAAYDAAEPLPTFAPNAAVTADYFAVVEHLHARGVL